MGKIVIHAGRPKAGSSSVQTWLADHVDDLRASDVLVAQAVMSKVRDVVHVREYRADRRVNSGDFIAAYMRLDDRPAHLDRFLSDMASLADSAPTVVITSESFANLLEPADEQFLQGLSELNRSHPVQIAYYVRPQHAALVSAWAQWGYRGYRKPAAYIESRATTHRYLTTLETVERLAPEVEMTVRPFRRDLFVGGGLVSDFVSTFLGLDDSIVEEAWANTSMPVDLANVLRAAPEGTFWTSDVKPRAAARKSGRPTNSYRAAVPLLEAWKVDESAAAISGRHLVHRWAHEQFEAENRELIERLGWPADEFIPPPPEGSGSDLEQLNELWTVDTLTPEQQMLICAVQDLGDAALELKRAHSSKGVAGRTLGPESRGRDFLRRVLRR
ncbi:MAG: hypothetical protein JJU45_03075 [Acidimicrobiia bacterium]|nr:hypothetical protein [Acidimicrobiia bacterium]